MFTFGRRGVGGGAGRGAGVSAYRIVSQTQKAKYYKNVFRFDLEIVLWKLYIIHSFKESTQYIDSGTILT